MEPGTFLEDPLVKVWSEQDPWDLLAPANTTFLFHTRRRETKFARIGNIINKCSERSVEVKLLALLVNYERNCSRPPADKKTDWVMGKFHFQYHNMLEVRKWWVKTSFSETSKSMD